MFSWSIFSSDRSTPKTDVNMEVKIMQTQDTDAMYVTQMSSMIEC